MTRRQWYGWQTLIADGASLALMAAASSSGSGSRNGTESLGYLGALGFVLGAPVVHWGHGSVSKGFGSLAIRAGTPLLGFLLLLDAFDNNSRGMNSSEAYLGIGLLIAWIPASITLDAAVLGYEEKKVPAVSLVPLVTPVKGGGTLGLGGTF